MTTGPCEWCEQGISKSADGQRHESQYGVWACAKNTATCGHSPFYTFDAVGRRYRAPCPWCLQRRIDFAIGELAEKPITPSAAEWVRVCTLAVLQGRISTTGDAIGQSAVHRPAKQRCDHPIITQMETNCDEPYIHRWCHNCGKSMPFRSYPLGEEK